MAVGDEMVVVM